MIQLRKVWAILLLGFFSLCLVLGGNYLIQHNIVTVQPTVTLNPDGTPVGMTVDTTKAVPKIILENFISTQDIIKPIESYSFVKTGEPTQYTYKYLSNKNISENSTYFSELIKKSYPGWTLSENISDKKKFVHLGYTDKQKNTLFFNINTRTATTSVVEITITN